MIGIAFTLSGARHSVPMILSSILLLTLGACSSLSPQDPEISLESVRPLNLSLSGQRLAITLNVANPNTFDLNVREINLTATLDGEPVATGESDARVTIPAEGQQTVELEVVAGLDVAFAQLRSMLSDNRSGLPYGVTGNVYLTNWPAAIPFDSTGRVDNPLNGESSGDTDR